MFWVTGEMKGERFFITGVPIRSASLERPILTQCEFTLFILVTNAWMGNTKLLLHLKFSTHQELISRSGSDPIPLILCGQKYQLLKRVVYGLLLKVCRS